jgi:peptide/nickel transport system substrate-binding protein
MLATTLGSPDPQADLQRFITSQIAQKANHWSGRNIVRWSNPVYDQLWMHGAAEGDPVKRASLVIQMNDLLIDDVVIIPIVWRNGVRAVSRTLSGMAPTSWDSDVWDVAYWYRQA